MPHPRRIKFLFLTVFLALAVARAYATSASEWNPGAYTAESTIELRTTAPEEGEHWFPVWLVVIDGQVYVRLGSRAADRMSKNTTAPYIAVKIAGQEFTRVKTEPAPDKVEAVAKAMADKYTSDLIIHYFSHPMTLRLKAE